MTVPTREGERADGGRCPRCASPRPELHPAVQHEGGVEICLHPFHGIAARGEAVDLTFDALRRANLARLPQFRNAKGVRYHDPDISRDSWTVADWLTATMGELGEAANLLKKIHRGDYDMQSKRREVADELADVAIYLDLLAAKLGVDLGAAIVGKFNAVSDRVGSTVRLPGAASGLPAVEGERRAEDTDRESREAWEALRERVMAAIRGVDQRDYTGHDLLNPSAVLARALAAAGGVFAQQEATAPRPHFPPLQARVGSWLLAKQAGKPKCSPLPQHCGAPDGVSKEAVLALLYQTARRTHEERGNGQLIDDLLAAVRALPEAQPEPLARVAAAAREAPIWSCRCGWAGAASEMTAAWSMVTSAMVARSPRCPRCGADGRELVRLASAVARDSAPAPDEDRP